MRARLLRCRFFALAFMLSFSIVNASAQSPAATELYVVALATVPAVSQQPIPTLPDALRGNSLYWRVLRSANAVSYQLCLGFFDTRSDAERARQQLATSFREARVFSVKPVERENLLKAQRAAGLAPIPAPPAESISPALPPPPVAADLNPAATPAPPSPNDQPGVVASAAARKTSIDLRVKLGGAAGVDHWDIPGIANGTATQKAGGNFQIDLAFLTESNSGVGFVGTLGVFGRRHSGNVPDPVLPTDIDYDAGGVAGSAGIAYSVNSNLHFEGRFELGIGTGKPTLTTPGVSWNSVQAKGYGSASLIAGVYYTFTDPRIQLGLELGTQSFQGDFQIWNNAGFWTDASVKGSGGIGNLTIGYRF